jgi:hypothetical protein
MIKHCKKRNYLVGGLEHVFHILGIIPTVTHSIIFQRRWLKPPTSYEQMMFPLPRLIPRGSNPKNPLKSHQQAVDIFGIAQ